MSEYFGDDDVKKGLKIVKKNKALLWEAGGSLQI